MSALKHIRRSPPWMMLVVLLFALGLNALAPSGYMIAVGDHGLPTVSVCPETHPLARAVSASREKREIHDGMGMDHASMGHAAMGHADDGDTTPAAANDAGCALAGAAKLAIQSLDEKLVAEETAYAVLLGLRAIRPLALPTPSHLRPPLRGPPPAI